MIKLQSGMGFPSSSLALSCYRWGLHDANGYYDALGLPPDCSFDQIKKKFREMARQYHPDGEEPDAETFREIKEIYDVLSDPVKRGEYNKVSGEQGDLYLGNLEKENLRSYAASQGIPVDSLMKTVPKPENFFDYFCDSEKHEVSLAWYGFLLEAAYLYRYQSIIRVGIRNLGNPIEVSNKLGYIIFWFNENISPNWISAFEAVSRVTDFLWKKQKPTFDSIAGRE